MKWSFGTKKRRERKSSIRREEEKGQLARSLMVHGLVWLELLDHKKTTNILEYKRRKINGGTILSLHGHRSLVHPLVSVKKCIPANIAINSANICLSVCLYTISS